MHAARRSAGCRAGGAQDVTSL
ncbi:hypothetical protein BDI4_600015 [Burkholderia diffusa]|nr:hypothetical protein BDI4_600015 [Burkholderia diffusa]